MSENETKKPAADTTEAKPESKPKTEKAVDPKPKKTEAKTDVAATKAAPVQPNKPRPRRSGLLSRRVNSAALPVETLARRTGTDSVVLGALKAAYGWTERTRLSQAEFLGLRDDWLKRPVKEG